MTTWLDARLLRGDASSEPAGARVIVDGVHRLLKASVEGRASLPARWVRRSDLPRIST